MVVVVGEVKLKHQVKEVDKEEEVVVEHSLLTQK